MACRFVGSNFWRFYRKSASQHVVFKRVIPRERLQDIIPYVQNMLEITEWKIQALKALPPRVSTAIPTDLIPQFDREHSYLTSVLPVMPRYNPDAIQNSFALMTSGASSAYAYILTIGHQGTMEYQDYSKNTFRFITDSKHRKIVQNPYVLC
jgi:hypothetical protein